MYPQICQIGPITIYSYGLMLAISVLVCSFLMSRDPYRGNLNSNDIFDLIFWTVLSGIVGARIFFVIANYKIFAESPSEIIMLQNGGLSFQGSILLGAMGAITFMKRKKLPILRTLDFLAPYIALGHGIGRIGCFLNGCCYGHKVSWGIYFPVHMAKLIPTQLYAFAALAMLFFVLKKMQKILQFPGQVFSMYLILYALLRFVIEFLRADHILLWMNLSLYQWISLLILGAGGLMYTLVSKRK